MIHRPRRDSSDFLGPALRGGAGRIRRSAVPWALGLLLIPWAVSPGAAQEARARALLEEAGARYQDLPAFCAGFSQELMVPLLGDTTRSRGELCQAQPNLFAMRFTEPAGDVVVADGEYFWAYYPSVDPVQVLQFTLASRPGGLDFQREFLENPGEKYRLSYEGEERVGDRTTHVISATPREEAGFTDARIWLDSERSLILKARIGMENGSVRTLSLVDIRPNPPPEPGRFRFTPPPGTRVIRR